MKLNARLQTAQNPVTQTPLVLIHGLFGSLDNLGILARGLKDSYHILQVDLRNHGLSPRSPSMRYADQAADIIDTLNAFEIDNATLIGHSMGGKVAMATSALAPERIASLLMLDIAPVDYQTRRHDAIFAALAAVTAAGVTTRHQAMAIMAEHIPEPSVIQFLLKSFADGEWRFNVPVLLSEYPQIVGWESLPAWPHPALFVRGGNSPYLTDEYQPELRQQFPYATVETISGTGHWLHAEKPAEVLAAIRDFLA